MERKFKTISTEGLLVLKKIEVSLPYMSEEQKHDLEMIATGMALAKSQEDARISELKKIIANLQAQLEQKAG